MHPSVEAFALAAGLLALGAALVHRFGFPPLPVYLLTGLLVGDRLPVEALEPLPSLGLLLLLSSVGLEFGPDRLRELSAKALRAGFYDALALPLGFLLGLLAGLDARGAALLAGVTYVSSSAVIAKLIVDLRRAANPESEVVLGVSVLEDLGVALLLALLGGQGPGGILAGGLLALAYFAFARYLGPLWCASWRGSPTSWSCSWARPLPPEPPSSSRRRAPRRGSVPSSPGSSPPRWA